MENKIQTSMDWAEVQQRIEAPIRSMKRYSHEMWNISHNIGLMVKDVSKEEINCRRLGKQTRLHKELVDKVNEEIANYERMMTFAVLLAG
jgi:PP-loop superfamily ATP-utilizing enzyme